MNLDDVLHRLDGLLGDAGCRRYTAREALADAAECWREVRQDEIACGELDEKPFFNFVVAEGVCVFAFYGKCVDFYVVPGEERDFRCHFESLAMTEVEAARVILAGELGCAVPDLTLDEAATRAWLNAV